MIDPSDPYVVDIFGDDSEPDSSEEMEPVVEELKEI